MEESDTERYRAGKEDLCSEIVASRQSPVASRQSPVASRNN
jgi:hypothetical protein